MTSSRSSSGNSGTWTLRRTGEQRDKTRTTLVDFVKQLCAQESGITPPIAIPARKFAGGCNCEGCTCDVARFIHERLFIKDSVR